MIILCCSDDTVGKSVFTFGLGACLVALQTLVTRYICAIRIIGTIGSPLHWMSTLCEKKHPTWQHSVAFPLCCHFFFFNFSFSQWLSCACLITFSWWEKVTEFCWEEAVETSLHTNATFVICVSPPQSPSLHLKSWRGIWWPVSLFQGLQ